MNTTRMIDVLSPEGSYLGGYAGPIRGGRDVVVFFCCPHGEVQERRYPIKRRSLHKAGDFAVAHYRDGIVVPWEHVSDLRKSRLLVEGDSDPIKDLEAPHG